MSSESTFQFEGRDGTPITAYRWTSADPVRGVLQVAHGMGEHALRYLEPLKPLRDAGITIYANDHRGHGQTAPNEAALGDFGLGGFGAVVDDMAVLAKTARHENPDKKLILLGHSMGSFAAQIFVLKHSKLIDGLVLSKSAALDLLPVSSDPKGASLEAYNAPFEPARTPFDWLSRDPSEVDKYIADPLCGFTVTPASMQSIFTAAAQLTAPGALKQIRPDLPIYIFSGDKDPLNGGLAWLKPLVDRYREAGIADVTYDFYKDGRHEMLNETNRSEVVAKLKAWIDRIIGN
ncbi:MAG: alpha/beta fold hydrolase [Alphaproteobacteria bacterium]|nr:alpha/beta fold hydrolase [Alphaproteobacteria bacterium]